MNVTFYGYAKCGTCRNALKWLKDKGHEVQFVDITTHPPTETELKSCIAKSGLEIQKFFNVSGELYRELGLKDKLPGMSAEEKLRLLASNGKLIKRPIVTDGSKITVGFKEEVFEEAWASC